MDEDVYSREQNFIEKQNFNEEQMNDRAEARYLPKVKFEAIPIRDLVSSQEYQRGKSERHIKRAAENFDVYQINPIKVSRRDGINYVVNGQHTMEIVAMVSGSRDSLVWCMVYDDLEYKREADIFANQQTYVKTLTPYEISGKAWDFLAGF